MAGVGSRFLNKGYQQPKPLIPIHDVPMIRLVIDNLRPTRPHRFIFICQESHIQQYQLDKKLQQWTDNAVIIAIDHITEGAACTVLKAQKFINNDNPLMIANCDQYIDCQIDDYLAFLDNDGYDAAIMTMRAHDPKWSYVGFDDNNNVNRVIEKHVISNEATVGIYNFKHGCDFVKHANMMIDNNQRVNGEFYVAPVYNSLLSQQNYNIGIYNIGEEANGMYGLGIPNDLDVFLSHPISITATNKVNTNADYLT